MKVIILNTDNILPFNRLRQEATEGPSKSRCHVLNLQRRWIQRHISDICWKLYIPHNQTDVQLWQGFTASQKKTKITKYLFPLELYILVFKNQKLTGPSIEWLRTDWFCSLSSWLVDMYNSKNSWIYYNSVIIFYIIIFYIK